MTDDDQMGWDEAVRLVMQRTGKNRRQAQAALIEKCRQGLLPATGINPHTGQREVVPPAAFPKVH
jgi:hypothetical protein